MSSAKASLPTTGIQADLEATFHSLTEQWHRETDHLSSQTQKAMHPAYQRIIGMGPAALPLIFQELESNSGHWSWALRAITGDDPTGPEDTGKIGNMREAWLSYARERGYLMEMRETSR
jgi:hypothetical protein